MEQEARSLEERLAELRAKGVQIRGFSSPFDARQRINNPVFDYSNEPELQQLLNHIESLREKVRTRAYLSDDAPAVLTKQLKEQQKLNAEKAQREADRQAKALVLAALEEKRERARNTNYVAIDDSIHKSERIIRRPSERNTGFVEVFIPKGEILFKEGQRADTIYLIDQGEMQIYSKAERLVLARLGLDQVFGEQAILYEGRRGASARAIVDSVCLEVSGEKWRESLKEQTPSVQQTFKTLMLEQIQSNFVNSEVRKPKTETLEDGSTVRRDTQILIPELYLFDPKKPLDLPTEYADQRHMHSLFSEIVFNDAAHIESVGTHQALLKLIQSSSGFVIVSGQLVFTRGDYEFFCGPGSVIGVAASMAGHRKDITFNFSDGIDEIRYIPIDGMDRFAEVRRLQSTIVRFTRALAMRCLGIQKVPPGLK